MMSVRKVRHVAFLGMLAVCHYFSFATMTTAQTVEEAKSCARTAIFKPQSLGTLRRSA